MKKVLANVHVDFGLYYYVVHVSLYTPFIEGRVVVDLPSLMAEMDSYTDKDTIVEETLRYIRGNSEKLDGERAFLHPRSRMVDLKNSLMVVEEQGIYVIYKPGIDRVMVMAVKEDMTTAKVPRKIRSWLRKVYGTVAKGRFFFADRCIRAAREEGVAITDFFITSIQEEEEDDD